MPEFALIDRLRRRVRGREDVPLGIGDDAALLQPAPGEQLAITADTLNAGVHFPPETAPADIGWKTLAVNLSDLAAMGAQPRWCTLSLSLPGDDPDWLEQFADGFFALADAHDIVLVGGDTTRGPLSLSVTAIGALPAGSALRRDAAQAGDDIWITGMPGEAAAALALWQAGTLAVDAIAAEPWQETLRQRLLRPSPRIDAGLRLRGLAHACVDVSDGLIADLAHICTRSGVGARIELARLPISEALRSAADPRVRQWQVGGGDDYELCFTAAPAHREAVRDALAFAAVDGHRIGRVVVGEGVQVLDEEGCEWQPGHSGYQHFG
jgi:thiamine-monophosphate kinase